MIAGLPNETWLQIAALLRPKSFNILRSASKNFAAICAGQRTLYMGVRSGMEARISTPVGKNVCSDVRHLVLYRTPTSLRFYEVPFIIRFYCKRVKSISWGSRHILNDHILALWTADGCQIHVPHRSAFGIRTFFQSPAPPSRYNLTHLHIRMRKEEASNYGKGYFSGR
jgi:hypothetical protein